jgi:hypothetical protein
VPRRNRVTPFGAIEADPARGTLMGNRGILHDATGALGRALWRHPHWVACLLRFKDLHREVLQPGTWTELFFLDEAVAFAAGHRPCAYCRRADYNRLIAAWRRAHDMAEGAPLGFNAIDRDLHRARVVPRTRRRRVFEARLGALPSGTFVDVGGAAWLVRGDRLLRWSHAGYDAARALDPEARVSVITPEPVVAAFRAGYGPALHPTAANWTGTTSPREG